MLQAVLFDLDGTLLSVHTEDLMNEYFKEIAGAVAGVIEPERFIQALLDSTGAMLNNLDPKLTNASVFWDDFSRRLGPGKAAELEPLLDDFYARKFSKLSRVVKPGGQAHEVVRKVVEMDLVIALATNPVFPATAIQERMKWAGIEHLPWALVTSYENMHFCKPHPEYYLEIAARLEVEPQRCLMVGNDVEKDILPAAAAGMRTYLVTDYLISDKKSSHRADGCGNLYCLIEWLNSNNYSAGCAPGSCTSKK